MMQVTRAAFQAVASLNEQATDPKSHTLVKNSLQDSFTSCYLLNSDGRPLVLVLLAGSARERAGVDPNSFFGKKGHAIFDGEINDLKSLDEALELGVVKERGKGLVAL
jgi:hypothetical protein